MRTFALSFPSARGALPPRAAAQGCLLLYSVSCLLPPLISTRNRALGALLGFCALAVVWTWPIAAHLSSRIAHDAGDPVLNTWILWWNAQALPFSSGWWNPPIMWPMPGAMALSEHLTGLSLVATPVQWLGGTPVTAYNLGLLITYALSGWFAFLLGTRLTGSMLAGVCAGLAFGYSPYRAGQLAHIQVLASQWMPLALLALHAYVETASTRWLAVFALAWLLQALSNGYYLLFFPVLIVLWLMWFVDWRRAPRRGLMIVAAWVLASLPLLPILLEYRTIHATLGLHRTTADIRDFSAVASSFVSASPLLAVWPLDRGSNDELNLFPGATVVILASVGLLHALRAPRRHDRAGLKACATSEHQRAPLPFYAAAAVVMFLLALGPGGQGTESASLLRPYTWLLWLPGFGELRVAARFAMLGSLCLAVAASLSMAMVSRQSDRARGSIAALVLCGLVLDGLTRAIPTAAPPPRLMLPATGSESVVIELPPDNPDVSRGAMYRSILHRRPTVNGYSGHVPPHYKVLSLALWRGDTSVLFYLARGRPLVIVVDDKADKGGFRGMVDAIPGIQRQGVSGAGSVFVLPAQPVDQRQVPGPALAARARDIGSGRLELDLGRPQAISALTFPLRQRYADLAERVSIEVSDDGQTWREAWNGWTGAFVLEATLNDPRVAPVHIPLSATQARYVRVYPSAAWMKEELQIR